ncbi:HPr family phosphocarrier protein [Parafrigoribacterium soli]|uniref:HPr family phosphocarrier protein n=1 Tax=Parafrigoribacterium soli TaxID=3144663 RepID=UPI0032EBD577
MAERRVVVASAVGLHARPAALFSQAAAQAGVTVTLSRPDAQPVNAASILGVLGLGIAHGDEVVLTAEGDGADEALDSLAALLSTDLDKA